MNELRAVARYGIVSQGFHWLVVLLVLGLLLTQTLHEASEGAPDGAGFPWINLHMSLGILIGLVTLARIAWTRLAPQPAPLPAPAWSLKAAKIMHLALNLATLLIPVGGYLRVASKGMEAHFFGMSLPSLVGDQPWLHSLTKIGHGEPMEIALYVLIGLHVAAALWHQYLLKDGALERMLPWGRRPAG